MTTVLIMAIESGRWGPARLPKSLHDAGLRTAALCPNDNALAATDFLDIHVSLSRSRNWRTLTSALTSAVDISDASFIIPADEQVVALFHFLIAHGPNQQLPQRVYELLRQSLGADADYEATLMKDKTLSLASKIGVPCPKSIAVVSANDAVNAAEGLGYPVFVKSSFSWAGQGVFRCDSRGDVLDVISNLSVRERAFKEAMRSLAGREWYAARSCISIQQSVSGRPAMYCALAREGELICGFAGIPRATTTATGPSTSLWLGAHSAMEDSARKMLSALKATGFIGFDFMLDDKSGQALLIECNPRPIQVCHLGSDLGIDLGQGLAAMLHKREMATIRLPVTAGLEVALFPHCLLDHRPASSEMLKDVPREDMGLMAFTDFLLSQDIAAWCARDGVGRRAATAELTRAPRKSLRDAR